MRELGTVEVSEVSGAGWFMYLLPIVAGFALGGPAGAVLAAGGLVLQTGVKNYEHLDKHGEIRTFDQIVN